MTSARTLGGVQTTAASGLASLRRASTPAKPGASKRARAASLVSTTPTSLAWSRASIAALWAWAMPPAPTRATLKSWGMRGMIVI